MAHKLIPIGIEDFKELILPKAMLYHETVTLSPGVYLLKDELLC